MRATDGLTNGQNYDSQDGASIAASRGKNGEATAVCLRLVIRLRSQAASLMTQPVDVVRQESSERKASEGS